MKGDNPPTREMPGGDLQVQVTARDHVRGPDTAPVTLVEYADYECPYSRMAYHVIKGVQRELGGQLRFVYRNFPLREIHPHAQHAAEAAEAAANQARFWEMHDFLFEHQRALDDEHLSQYAAALGLETEIFDREMAQHRYAGKIERDLLGGVQSGVRGTPTFFINGVRYEGSFDRESLLSTIWEATSPRGELSVATQCSRRDLVDILSRTGFSELADELPRLLPDPVDLDHAVRVLEPYGINKNELISRMGGSP